METSKGYSYNDLTKVHVQSRGPIYRTQLLTNVNNYINSPVWPTASQKQGLAQKRSQSTQVYEPEYQQPKSIRTRTTVRIRTKNPFQSNSNYINISDFTKARSPSDLDHIKDTFKLEEDVLKRVSFSSKVKADSVFGSNSQPIVLPIKRLDQEQNSERAHVLKSRTETDFSTSTKKSILKDSHLIQNKSASNFAKAVNKSASSLGSSTSLSATPLPSQQTYKIDVTINTRSSMPLSKNCSNSIKSCLKSTSKSNVSFKSY